MVPDLNLTSRVSGAIKRGFGNVCCWKEYKKAKCVNFCGIVIM